MRSAISQRLLDEIAFWCHRDRLIGHSVDAEFVDLLKDALQECDKMQEIRDASALVQQTARMQGILI